MTTGASHSDADTADRDDPAVAFDGMSRRLAGLTAAIEGFAVRQQELHARDYGADLARIHSQQARIRNAIVTLAEQPGVALTPQTIAAEIESAGAEVRAADHRAWAQAQRELIDAARALEAATASARSGQAQKRWIVGAAAVAIIVGFALGAVIPAKIDQAVPEEWHWPEARAASVLRRGGWDAGVRLLQVADPQRWRALQEAARIVSDNADTLAACRAQAAKASGRTSCRIKLERATIG